jgi:CubicO group peptidase (beta-lactamase class C family)
MTLYNHFRLSLVVFIGLVSCSRIPAQITPTQEKEIDTVFEEWKDPTKPGVSAGIIKDGEIIYLKSFGTANMEMGTPITAETKFQLGELSKQFTSLAILVLEEQGKIKQNDDIRKYLPEMPEYNHTITIGHLLNHSSGLYDVQKVSTIINGTTLIATQAKALELIASQKTLSYPPGTRFSYHESPTESILMAEIVARSSKQSFADFVKNSIFEPLGMKNSLVRDNSGTILSNVAEPYQKEEESVVFKKNEVFSSVVGAINGYSSAEDLVKWYVNFTHPKSDLGRLVQKLDTPVKLTNGKKFVYYWGEMAIGREFSHPDRGLLKFWNFGIQGGYGTNIFRFTNEKITAFVLGNNNQYNGSLAMDAVDPLVKNLYPLPDAIDFKALKTKKLSTKKLKEFEGDYWFKEGYPSKLFVENDTLHSRWLFSERSQKLVPLSDDTFQQMGANDDVRIFKFIKESDAMTLSFTYNESRPDVMERYQPVVPSEQALQLYAGTYYNAEYASLFTFRIEEGQLVASNIDHEDIKFRPTKKDVFTSTSMFFNALEFLRDNSNRVQGFKMVTDGVHHLEFEKAPSIQPSGD